VYDGGTAAAISGRSLSGVLAISQVSLEGGSARFLDAAAGTSKEVVGDGFTLAGADRGNYTLSPQPYQTTASITPAFVIGSFTAADKEFDGGTAATILSRGLSGVLAGDQVSLVGGSARFGSPDVGSGKPVFASAFQLSGPAQANYRLRDAQLISFASILAGPPRPPGPGDPGIRDVPYYPIFQALQLNPLIEVPSSGQPLPGPGAAQVPAAQLVGAVEMARNPASDLGGYLDGTAPVPDRAPAPPMVRSGAPMDLQNPQGPYRDQEAKASAMAGELGLKKSPADLEPPSSESLQEWLRRNAATVRQGVSAP
jgi:hypothetical protein